MDKTGILKKLYFKQWVIGLAHGDIKNIIRTKRFSQDIKWLEPGTRNHFQADPFLLNSQNGFVDILYEEFSMDENYGNISLMTLDKDLNQVSSKPLLDTGSHLSFPFIFSEGGRTFVFPESAKKGCLSCYLYDEEKQTLNYLTNILEMPLYDPAIIKHEGKYWLFGTIFENRMNYKLHIFHSDSLLGMYTPLRSNPVKKGLNGNRAAGNFINVDGVIYRPTQNCSGMYGESITINRIKVLTENLFSEEPYMTIRINEVNRTEHNIHTIHTINSFNGLIVVDGMKWTFSPKDQWDNFKRNRRLVKAHPNH
jgi:hypothetical protein